MDGLMVVIEIVVTVVVTTVMLVVVGRIMAVTEIAVMIQVSGSGSVEHLELVCWLPWRLGAGKTLVSDLEILSPLV